MSVAEKSSSTKLTTQWVLFLNSQLFIFYFLRTAKWNGESEFNSNALENDQTYDLS